MVEGDVIVKTMCGVIQEPVVAIDKKSFRKRQNGTSSEAGDTSFRSNNLKIGKK